MHNSEKLHVSPRKYHGKILMLSYFIVENMLNKSIGKPLQSFTYDSVNKLES